MRRKILGMNVHLLLYCLLAIVVGIALPTYIRVIRSPAYRQTPEQLVTRDPGNRLLGAPRDAAPEARIDLEFALLSQAAYQRTADAQQVKAGASLDADATLASMGWCRWTDFPAGDVKAQVDKVHLRVEVWSNASTNKIAVAFGGTVARNIKDWESDLRWFIHFKQDQYSVIVQTFGDAFVDAYLKRKSTANCRFPDHPQVFSTGHSLGGGLAQDFAYSLPENAGVPRVTKVFAFDPSPVTGFYSVEESLRTFNSHGLLIDRIYERGEILAYARSIINFFYKPSAVNAEIRQLRFNLFPTHNPFAGHSIAELALKLKQVSEHKPVS